MIKINFPSVLLCFVMLLVTLTTYAEQWPTVNLLETKQEQLPQAVNITVSKDAVYQTQKKYSGYPLNEFINNLALPKSYTADETVLVFTSTDGYKAFMTYNDALREQGYIAFQDLSAAAGKQWIPFKFGKEHMTPAPYYLVWPKKELDKWQYPWPFQLAEISLQPAKVFFGAAAPISSNQRVNKGFMLFNKYCIRCHAINHSGGSVGPELNEPVNVTEYFDERELPGFILNAPKYRTDTKMPAFTNIINTSQVEDIIIYLKNMESEKKPD